MALEMAAFFRTKPYTKDDFSIAELYNYIQSMLISIVALSIIILPLLQKGTPLRESTSRWVHWWATLGIVTAILSPAIYYPAGHAWSHLVATVSAICTAFVSLQLVQGLRKTIRIKDHAL